MKSMKGKALLATFIVGAMLLASCGAGEDDPDSDGPVAITVLAEDIPVGLNPDGPSIAIPTTQTGVVNLMEPLIYYTPGEQNEDGVQLFDFESFEGRLAESWDFDEETLTWTLHLREGVVGCDGNTFDADDVVYSFARAKAVAGAAPVGWFLSNVASIDGFTTDVFEGDTELGDEVRKVDDYTVEIRQSAPNKLFLPVLTIFALSIFDKETMEANATDDDPWSHDYTNAENAPSFGPYCLESWEPDSQFVVSANEDYYLGKPPIDRIVYRKVPESANRVAAVQRGDAQLVEHLTPREFDTLRGDDSVGVAGVLGNENLFIHMNYETPPLDDINVRKAIAHAVPYDQIIETGYYGQASRWEGLIPSSYPGFHRSDTQYDYDPDRARELLAEAGYPDGQGLEQFRGIFDMAYVAEKESTLGPIATVIQSSLAEIGIPVALDPMPQTQYGDRQLVRKDLPFAINDQEKPIGVDAGYATLLFFVSTEAGGLNNMVNYANAEIDQLFTEMLNESDDQVRDAFLADIQDILMDEVAWLPIVEWRTQWAFSNDLQGVTWHPDNSVRWADLEMNR